MTNISNNRILSNELEQLLNKFKELSLEDKKQKLLNVITSIQTTNKTLNDIEEAIKINSHVDDEFLDGVYIDIMYFADMLQKWDKEKAIQWLQKSQEYLKNLQRMEAQEHKQEESELEWMLSEIETL